MSDHIKSESKFIWKLALKILLLPFTFIAILLGKKPLKELWLPITMLIEFIKEAKITFTLIIINIIIFFISLFFSEQLFLSLASHPSDLFTFHWHTLITSGFLHSGIGHLVGNMIALFIFGRIVERELGPKKFILIYFLALIISGVISSLIHYFILGSSIPSVGASGAIMGIIAAAILLDPFYLNYQLLIPIPVMILGWFYIIADVSGVLSGVQTNIGHFAHLGGFISISIILFFLEKNDRAKLKKGFITNIISIVVLGLAYVLFLHKYL